MRCAIIHGARGDTERARETETTSPSAARSACCAHARTSLQTSTELYRSGTLSRSGTPRWRTREKKRPHRLTIPRYALPTRPYNSGIMRGDTVGITTPSLGGAIIAFLGVVLL